MNNNISNLYSNLINFYCGNFTSAEEINKSDIRYITNPQGKKVCMIGTSIIMDKLPSFPFIRNQIQNFKHKYKPFNKEVIYAATEKAARFMEARNSLKETFSSGACETIFNYLDLKTLLLIQRVSKADKELVLEYLKRPAVIDLKHVPLKFFGGKLSDILKKLNEGRDEKSHYTFDNLRLDYINMEGVDVDDKKNECTKIIKQTANCLINVPLQRSNLSLVRNAHNLTHLDLSDLEITDNELKAFYPLVNLKYLNLSSNKLEKEIATISNFNDLESLNLSNNSLDLTHEVKFFDKLTNLKELNLSNSFKYTKGLIKIISKLQQLVKLDLSFNYLKKQEISHFLNLKKITSLYLSETSLKHESITIIGKLESLQVLDLSNNQIGSKGVQELSPLKHLKELNLANNSIKDEDGVSKTISSFSELRILDLSDNDIADKVAKGVYNLHKLTVLKLNDDIDDSVNKPEKAHSLSLLKNLTVLSLPGSNIGPKGAKAISTLSNLIELNLSFNYIELDGSKSISELIGLRKLDLSYNDIRDGYYISKLINLQELYLENNEIEDRAISPIYNLTNLTKLDISANPIQTRGLKGISKLVNLVTLDISDTFANLSKNEVDFSEEIGSLIKLKTFKCAGNSLTDDRSDFLSNLVNLTDLDLPDNELSDESAKKISALNNLKNLDLYSNQITNKGVPPLLNLRLTKLNLMSNSIGRTVKLSLKNLNDSQGMSVLVYF